MNNSIKTTVSDSISKPVKNKINCPLMYQGFIIRNKKVNEGYKLEAYSYQKDIFINPLYTSFDSIKLVIDSLK